MCIQISKTGGGDFACNIIDNSIIYFLDVLVSTSSGTNRGVWKQKQIKPLILVSAQHLLQTGNGGKSVTSAFGLLVSSRFLFIALRASDVETDASLAVLLLRSSLIVQIEHILSRRCCWRVLGTLLRGGGTGGKGKRGWVGAEFLVRTRTPEWRPSLSEDVASWVQSCGRG